MSLKVGTTSILGVYTPSLTPKLITKSINENGTYRASDDNADGYSGVTVNVSGGSSGTPAVVFIDYDGTELHSYTSAEFAELTALPSNPTHTGLTSQGWNWTLSDIQTQLTAMPNQTVYVGQMYVTDDGKTRLYCTFTEDILTFRLGVCPRGTVEIDWGDGSNTETVTGTAVTSVIYTPHTYLSIGDYVITLNLISGYEYAFYSLSSGPSLVLSPTINTTNAMANIPYLSAIKKVELGSGFTLNSLYAFAYCYSLSSITIPSTNTVIGGSSFVYCSSLSSVTIPSGVATIGSLLVSYCYSLSSISIPYGVRTISNAFQSCYSLHSLTIPDSVTSISSSAFYFCYALPSIIIPDGVTSIGSQTFRDCHALSSIIIPSSVTSISTYAFQNCYTLSSISIPDGVTSISTYAFWGCCTLSSVTLPSNITVINASTFRECGMLRSIIIPDGVTSIGEYAFYRCCSLSSITLPNSVTSIGNYTFRECYTLPSITIPNGVTSIGTYAFYGCYLLSSITIPGNVTSIGNYAFADCRAISEYHFQSTTPPTLGTNVFQNILADTKIYVPQASLSAYQSASNWSTYASYMVGE